MAGGIDTGIDAFFTDTCSICKKSIEVPIDLINATWIFCKTCTIKFNGPSSAADYCKKHKILQRDF